jgi:hypothetical protein
MQRFIAQCNDTGLISNAFAAQANLLSGGIIRQLDTFSTGLRSFHDRTGQTESGLPSPRGGHGRAQRVHEKLIEEEGINVAYSTLTQMLREQGLSKNRSGRCHRVPDEPGVEIQHDTSPYRVRLGGMSGPVQGSLIYFRYSKIRYLKFYRSFKRFGMKCFFHEALVYWGYAAKNCIIDNTNLARLRGTGANAVIVPEMECFANQYGFKFVCHEKGHANRKAGNERGFYTVETNFFPGRSFV